IKPERKALEPGGTTKIALDVRDHSGRAVSNAALALVVVDESVLALAGYKLPDPLEVFYPPRGNGVSEYETRLRIALMRPDTARVSLKAKAKPAKAHGPRPKMSAMRAMKAAPGDPLAQSEDAYGYGSLGLTGAGRGGGGKEEEKT